MFMKRLFFPVMLCLGLVAGGLVLTEPGRALLRPIKHVIEFRAFVAGLPVESDLAEYKVEMPDGVHLATDVYIPTGGAARKPVILVRLPYGKRLYGEALHWVRLFSAHDYAVVVQDMRGRYGSEGVFSPYPNEGKDGVATLDWIVKQPWAQDRVGTIGCSALGEAQILLAAERHPAHRAMIPMGAGGAIGTAKGAYGFFGFYEGGIMTLASGFGWFLGQGGKTGDAMHAPDVEYGQALKTLPVINAVSRYREDDTDFEELLSGFDDPAVHDSWGYISDADRFDVPSLMVDTWYDYGIGFSFQLNQMIGKANPKTHLLVAPATHCDMAGPFRNGAVGDVPVAKDAAIPFDDIYLGFMDHQLKGKGLFSFPRFQTYMLNQDRWLKSQSWPPETAQKRVFYLGGETLGDAPPTNAQTRSFLSDPADPVPTVGGAICCTGDPESRAGPLDQSPIEDRKDLLLFTSDVFEQPLEIAGPLMAHLAVSTDVPDTDLVVRLSDVSPDGRSVLIQEGALRLRYRNGFDVPELMQPDQIYQVQVSLRHIAYQLAAGHKLRLHIAGSSFPRLARNMNTGGDPNLESTPRVANITLHSGGRFDSRVEMFVMPADNLGK